MRLNPHSRAILQALLVTFLWSTSWILIKFALDEIPPITFAGLRYSLAFIILLPGLWKRKDQVGGMNRKTWQRLCILGLVFYAMTQGGVFVSLKYLESVTFSLMLNFTTLLVAIGSMIALREFPTVRQWAGIIFFLTGVVVYFKPLELPQGGWFGLMLGILTVCANAAAAIMGRSVNKDESLSPWVVTTISMGMGAVILLGLGISFQGLPQISFQGWATIVWLAVVNTAFAFTLWNKSLQILSAVESSIINNTMLIQITVLAWIFLGEDVTWIEAGGLLLALLGTLVVQVSRPRLERSESDRAETIL
jgi:drug/metabolite transporter (DMT)-like permease